MARGPLLTGQRQRPPRGDPAPRQSVSPIDDPQLLRTRGHPRVRRPQVWPRGPTRAGVHRSSPCHAVMAALFVEAPRSRISGDDTVRREGTDAARPLPEVPQRFGYGSGSAFCTAFRRHVGQRPSQYAEAGENLTGPPTPVTSPRACGLRRRRRSRSTIRTIGCPSMPRWLLPVATLLAIPDRRTRSSCR